MVRNDRAHILIIDDFDENRRLLAHLVTTHINSRVSLARSGHAVMGLFEENPPDLVLLDVRMPDASGFQIAERIRALAPVVPVVFVTGMSDPDSIDRAFDAGISDYITKPVRVREFVARVTTQLTVKMLRDELVRKERRIKELRRSIGDPSS